MIKKKLSILLSLSLAVLFISLLGTTSYADYWTEDEIKNIIYNYQTNFGTNGTEEQIATFKTSLENINFSALSLASQNYDYFGLACQANSWTNNNSKYMFFYGNYWNATNKPTINIFYNQTRVIYKLNSSQIIYNTEYSNSSVNNTTTQNGYTSDNWVLVPYDLYNATNGDTIVKAKGLYPSNLANGPFNSDYFTFLLNANLNTITINGDSVPFIEHNTNQASTYVLGELGLASNFYNAELFTYRWQQGSWKLQNIRTLENIGPTTDNLIEVTIRGDWINPNTLYSLQMNPDPDSEFAPYSQPFFVKNRYTSITNGTLDLDNTFSGDYYNNYNNDTNTEDIINNINDDSQVTAILGDFFNSGDSGDSMLSSLGFDFIKRIDNPFVATIRTIFLGLLNCFLDNSDVVLDLGHHGMHMYISSADFSNTGSGDVFILVKYALEGLWIFFFCKAGYTILTHATTADINGLLNDVDVDGTWHNPMDRGDWRLM